MLAIEKETFQTLILKSDNFYKCSLCEGTTILSHWLWCLDVFSSSRLFKCVWAQFFTHQIYLKHIPWSNAFWPGIIYFSLQSSIYSYMHGRYYLNALFFYHNNTLLLVVLFCARKFASLRLVFWNWSMICVNSVSAAASSGHKCISPQSFDGAPWRYPKKVLPWK